jgi:hypothetical protein
MQLSLFTDKATCQSCQQEKTGVEFSHEAQKWLCDECQYPEIEKSEAPQESFSDGIECPYCEKKREQVNCAMSIDNEFDYCCVVCNLEYLSWNGKTMHNEVYTEYKNNKLIRRYEEALRSDKKNNDAAWKPHLKTITERSEIYARENIERKGNE